MKTKLKFWIKERHNPQTGTYFVAMGQMSNAAAAKHNNCLYGDNIMHPFATEAEYSTKLAELRRTERVQ